jgi:hypothetical protein
MSIAKLLSCCPIHPSISHAAPFGASYREGDAVTLENQCSTINEF